MENLIQSQVTQDRAESHLSGFDFIGKINRI